MVTLNKNNNCEMSSNIQKYILSKYNWDDIVKKIEEIYKKNIEIIFEK